MPDGNMNCGAGAGRAEDPIVRRAADYAPLIAALMPPSGAEFTQINVNATLLHLFAFSLLE